MNTDVVKALAGYGCDEWETSRTEEASFWILQLGER